MYLEVNKMDLRNNQITLGELWDNPRSRAVFQKRIPMLAKHPLQGAARTVTLEQLRDEVMRNARQTRDFFASHPEI